MLFPILIGTLDSFWLILVEVVSKRVLEIIVEIEFSKDPFVKDVSMKYSILFC